MYDVIIVGAGPAGTSCAEKLAKNGFSIKVYDRRAEIGNPKRCGEGIEKKIENYIGKIPSRCIAQKVKGAIVYAPNGKSLRIDDKYGGYVLERKVFDKWLAEKAAAAGAEIQANTLITDLIIENGYVKGVKGGFLGESFEERAKIVVASTGAESPLPKQAGINTTCSLRLIDTCLQYEMVGVKSNPSYVHIYFGNQIAPRGYSWIFCKGNGRANVGVGVIPHEKRPKYYLDNFVKSNKELKGASIIEVNAGAVPVGGLLKDMVSNGFVVCGEAAHHVNPIHGGGMKEAIISGQIAAGVIVKCLKRNDVSKKALSEFNSAWWKERGNHLKIVEKGREVIEKMTDDDFNLLVDALKPEDIIGLAQGKTTAFLKVMTREPRLLKFVAILK